MKLSACWITKNEAEVIARSIESVRDIVDEMILVDTGSTDDTVSIARSLGVKTDFFQWVGDFSAARNYAISLASGDVILFPDGDEWFEPKLDKKHREVLEKAYRHRPVIEQFQVVVHNLEQSDSSRGDIVLPRLYRRRSDLRYQGIIHEQMTKDNGGQLSTAFLDGWILYHSGYTTENLIKKMPRNIAMLEDALAASTDPLERFLNQCYLMREIINQGNDIRAVEYLNEVLKHPRELEECCKIYGDNFVSILYVAMNLAWRQRARVSRLEIRRKLADVMERLYPQYTGTPVMPLFYQLLFDLKEDRLLAELEPAIQKARKLPPAKVTEYQPVESMVYSAAAAAAWNRGDKAQALDYAVAALPRYHRTQEQTLNILLSCIKGQPDGDIVMFINSLIDTADPGKLERVIQATRRKGFLTVHAYYMNKQIEGGGATKGSFLYLLLLHKKYAESVEMALSMYDEANGETVSRHLFLTAVCSGNEAFYRNNTQYLQPYAHVLEAYFSGRGLTEAGVKELGILTNTYPLVALAEGTETAGRLLSVFQSVLPRECFQAKADYYIHNGRYDHLILESGPTVNPFDAGCSQRLLRCELALGRYAQALNRIEGFLGRGKVWPELMHGLLIVAEKGGDLFSPRARELYDRYIVAMDCVVDLDDIIRTGIIPDEGGEKALKALKTLTLDVFRRQLREDGAKQAVPELVELFSQAAVLCEEKERYAKAYECYRWLAAHGEEPGKSYAGLARIFRQLGNESLAAELEALAR